MISEIFTNFHFLRPLWLLLLFIPLVGYKYIFQTLNSYSSWEKVCDKNLLNFLLIKGSSSQRKTFKWVAFLGYIFLVLALAGPTWKKIPMPTLTPENPVIIALNLSSDMMKNDVQPSRLERAKFKIIDLLSEIKTGQFGLIVYTNEPFLISPITDDKKIIINLLSAVDFNIMPKNGDRLDRAILYSMEKLKNAGYKNGNILVVSADVGERFDMALQNAQKASEQNFDVNVLPVAKGQNEKLKLIARYGKGIFEEISPNDADIQQFVKQFQLDEASLKENQNKQEQWFDMGYYLVFVPLVCCLLFFRKGIFIFIIACLFSYPASAQWFLNQNQKGLKAFEQGDFEKAEQNFEDPTWQAATAYKLGNYDKAAKYYAKHNDVTSMYNLGNALAKSQKIEEAIKKYEEVLKIDPNHEDAKFNLEYLKQQQNQQNQQNQNNQDQKQEDKPDNNSSQGQPSPAQDDKSDVNEGNNPQNQNSAGEDNSKQKEQPQEGEEKNKEETSENTAESYSKQQESPQNQPQSEEKEQQAGFDGNAKKGDQYDEKTQAKAQQLRQIPEDPGGLLKAFIAREYRLNRYGDEE